MTYLALDIGHKTVGVAGVDALGLTVQPLVTLKDLPRHGLFAALWSLLKERSITDVVVGLPMTLRDEEGPQAQWVKKWVHEWLAYLHNRHCQPVIHYWDESFSTADADAVLRSAGMASQKRKRVVDKLAAALILDDFLQHHGAKA